MRTVGLVVGLVGVVGSFAAALWLLVGFDAASPRYTDDGMLYPGQQRSVVVQHLLEDQRRVSVLVLVCATLQVVGAVLAFWS